MEQLQLTRENLVKHLRQIPFVIHILYFLLAVTVCFVYFQKIISPANFDSINSLNTVASFTGYKPYQFRLLLPLLFKLLSVIPLISQKYLFTVFCCLAVYFLQVVYFLVIEEFFSNTSLNLFLAPLILYPVVWDFLILNETFQYYDFSSLLFFTLGLYFIIKDNFKWLLVTFIAGVVNKESIVYLLFCYLFFNYRSIFTKKIIFNTAIMSLIFLAFKIAVSYIFRNNDGSSFELGFYGNIEIIKAIPHNLIYLRNIVLNLGLLYIFAVLLFVTGKWKLFKRRDLLFVNLAVVPFVLIGIFTIYFPEVRVYSETMPLFTNLFLIYLSTFDKLGLKIKEKI